MCQWLIFLYVLVFAVAKPNGKDECHPMCSGPDYECIDGKCYCAAGLIQNAFQTACVKCPDLGEKCFGTCCSSDENISLQCWHGVCQPCYDAFGNWRCRDTVNQILLVSTTQVVMGTALILGVIATMILLFKLCATANLRPLGSRNNSDSRLSIGSLQMYVDERLRDAPPRYTRASPNVVAVPAGHQNDGFVHDSSTPPPPYTELKNEDSQSPTVHM